MDVFLIFLTFTLMLLGWALLGMAMIGAFVLIYVIPCFIIEGFCALTINNLINIVAKIPLIGWFLAIAMTLPMSVFTIGASLYCGLLNLGGPLIWCLQGFPGGKEEALRRTDSFVLEPLHLLNWCGCDWDFNPAVFFMNHCEWIYKYSGMSCSLMPWVDTENLIEKGGLILFILKITILGLPYTLSFFLPIIMIFWSIARLFFGAIGRLPALIHD